MQTYQIDTLISGNGIIELPQFPYLYNKKVKLIIISTEDNKTQLEQRKQAFEQIKKRHNAIPATQWTDEELDNMKYEYLQEKHK
jgi:hypothetical protein